MLEIESNDTILLSSVVVELEVGSGAEITGEIASSNDVDLFGVELNAGDTLFADINAGINGSELDSVLSIFDADGNLLVQNEDNSFEQDGETVVESDPFQQFTAIASGVYYVGVSAAENLDYDPNLADSGTGNSSGDYSLDLSIGEFIPDQQASEPNDIFSFATLIEFNDLEDLSPIVIAGEIGDNSIDFEAEGDVDLFAIELEEGETISIDINAEIIGSGLDSVLSIFDINGELLLQSDDNSFEVEGELITELDPFSQLTAPEDGFYYIGVSSFGNFDYDPISIEIASNTGESTGFYNLVLSLGEETTEVEEEISDLEIGGEGSGSGIGNPSTDEDPSDSGTLGDDIFDILDTIFSDFGIIF